MDDALKTVVWQQFSAALDMLEQATVRCPDELWDAPGTPTFAALVWHTLAWLDHHLKRVVPGLPTPAPFTVAEPLPAEVAADLPRADLLTYLAHGRHKAQLALNVLDQDTPTAILAFELLLYNTRHIQHHTGQLDLILRRQTGSAPAWIGK